MAEVESRRDGAVLTITLNRPEVLNALDGATHTALAAALEEARDPAIRAVVLTGAGRGFCVGQDLQEFRSGADDVAQRLRDRYHRQVFSIRGLEKPVIAVVNGPAAGAGFERDDVVMSWNGVRVEGMRQFQRMVAETPPGREVEAEVVRAGSLETLRVTVGSRREAPAASGGWPPGIDLRSLAPGWPGPRSWQGGLDDDLAETATTRRPKLGVELLPLSSQLAASPLQGPMAMTTAPAGTLVPEARRMAVMLSPAVSKPTTSPCRTSAPMFSAAWASPRVYL